MGQLRLPSGKQRCKSVFSLQQFFIIGVFGAILVKHGVGVQTARVGGRTYMPRLSWDFYKLPVGNHTVGWGKGVLRGQQYFIPKHSGTSLPVILPIGTQYMEASKELVVGIQSCPALTQLELHNRQDIDESTAKFGDDRGVGAKPLALHCEIFLYKYDARTGNHVATFRSVFDGGGRGTVMGFYVNEPKNEHCPEASNTVLLWYWGQWVSKSMSICTAQEKSYFRTNGPSGAEEDLIDGRSYRLAFGGTDDEVRRNAHLTTAYHLPQGVKLCRQKTKEKDWGTRPDPERNVRAMDLEFISSDCIALANTAMLPLMSVSCEEVPFDPAVPLGRIILTSLPFDTTNPNLYQPSRDWSTFNVNAKAIYRGTRVVLPRSRFRSKVIRKEHVVDGYNYFMAYYHMVADEKTNYPWKSCAVSEVMIRPLRIAHHPLSCARCEDFGYSYTNRSSGLLVFWCIDSLTSSADLGPGLVLNEITVDKRSVTFLLHHDAKLPASQPYKTNSLYNWYRDVNVISRPGSDTIYAFYICDMYPNLEDFRFGPVASSSILWGTFKNTATSVNQTPARGRPIISEVFSPELNSLSVVLVDPAEELFMLLFENAIDQVFNGILFTAKNGGEILEGADLLLPDSAPQAYDSAAYGTRFESSFDNVAYKIQLSPESAGSFHARTLKAPPLPDASAKSFSHFHRIRASIFEAACDGSWLPPLRDASCTPACYKFQTFRTKIETSVNANCPWKDGTLRAVPCSSSGCSWAEFAVTDPGLEASVDRNVRTAGATFFPGSLSPVTFDLKRISDITEVLLVFNETIIGPQFDVEISFLNGLGQEFSVTRIATGGNQFPVDFPFDRTYVRNCSWNEPCAQKFRHTNTGSVVKASNMQVYGVQGIGIVYHGGDHQVELLEISVKGRQELLECPGHGFFSNQGRCPPPSNILIPAELEDLDCQGFWTEWTTCDHFCRKLRFFSRSRDPLPGGKPCPFVEHMACNEGRYCNVNDEKFASVLDNFKDRSCEYEVGEWSDCVNCRELRYTHILTQAARRGDPCPAELIETRFCNSQCEKLFAEGSSSSTSSSTSTSTTSSSSSSVTSTRHTQPKTVTGTTSSNTESLSEYIATGIMAANALFFVLVLGAGVCCLVRKSRRFQRSLEARRNMIQLKKDIYHAKTSAALIAAAEATASHSKETHGLPLKGNPLPEEEKSLPAKEEPLPQEMKRPGITVAERKTKKADQLSCPRGRRTLFPKSDLDTGEYETDPVLGQPPAAVESTR
ncbi:hypothetical protein TGME49_237585 [Toxoplasma gondii ME49]|uniref:Transmembrane protein n=2 Tax=Toxoplasma gondii TaxID=5811 RepID=S8EZH6_TOXGM|nr:hypothetical protein TGME49_237585 [Toxoplasma gondii ME49]EPT26583.1 hypothetical protein TGME49_237585 [Toxoplasma gondii ME49]KFG35836.1 putative transmembrane protein [Toxoplasma gondii GAB2-2007-GAL-DOM2]|eukprot:XP_018635755.1 hypothetical protein TGME49_237585 [Toxoplasma gondii ME49]